MVKIGWFISNEDVVFQLELKGKKYKGVLTFLENPENWEEDLMEVVKNE